MINSDANIDANTQKRIEELEKKSAERSLSKDILLPECPDAKRGTPNGFLRSALFSAIQSKDRVWLKDTILGYDNDSFIFGHKAASRCFCIVQKNERYFGTAP